MAKTIDRSELIMYRKEFLRQMDDYVKDMIGDENIIQKWFINGLPNGYDDIDLQEIASDDELWLDCVNCFASCCKAVDLI
jgi:hypothetical protein